MRRYILLLCFTLFAVNLTLAQDNVVDVTISNPQPFIGERIVYTVTFTSSLDLSGAQIRLPQFVGFAQEPQTPTLSTVPVNNVIQNVVQQDIILYPNRTDQIIIDTATIIVPETPFQSGIEVTSNTFPIVVSALPEGAPETFTGGVGQFDISATIDPPTIQAGNPNTLRITVTGSGNFSQLTSPQLRLPDTWDVFPGTSTTTTTGANLQAKTFEYQFFADQTGSVELPAIVFSYFDPLTTSYRTLTTQAGSINVEGDFTASQSSNTIQSNNRLELKPMTDRPDTLLPNNTFWFLWLITPCLALVFAISRLATRPSQPKATETTRKQSKSLKAVSAQFGLAKNADPNQAYAIIEQTIFQYLSSKYKQDINSNNLDEATANLPETIQQRLHVCIEQSQAGRYAPVTEDDVNKLIRRTYKTLQMIEEERK